MVIPPHASPLGTRSIDKFLVFMVKQLVYPVKFCATMDP